MKISKLSMSTINGPDAIIGISEHVENEVELPPEV